MHLHKPTYDEVVGFIHEVHYWHVPNTNMTVAVGITKTGHPMPPVQSCCAMASDYNEGVGRETAFKKVVDQTFDYYIAHMRSLDNATPT